jgi:hypothetical protein
MYLYYNKEGVEVNVTTRVRKHFFEHVCVENNRVYHISNNEAMLILLQLVKRAEYTCPHKIEASRK